MSKSPEDADAAGLKAKYGVDTSGTSNKEVDRGIATAAARLATLGRPDLMRGMKVELFPGGKPTGSKCSSFTPSPKHVQIVTYCEKNDGAVRNSNAAAVGLNILHEVGHAAGQGKYYDDYFRSVTKRCEISRYCTHNSNNNPRREEFAEVFAAFVHSPDALKANCSEAYEFMKSTVFGGVASNASICRGVPAVTYANVNQGSVNYTSPSGSLRSDTADIGQQTASFGDSMLPIIAAYAQAAMQAKPVQESDIMDLTPTERVIPATNRNPATNANPQAR